MSANQESVSQFVAVTGASQEAAEFFLESSGGNVEAAVDAFFASDGSIPSRTPATAPAVAEAPARPDTDRATGGGPTSRRPAPARAPPRGIRSFADLGDQNSESDEDDSNEYYAGGQKSGQVVKGGDNRHAHVDNLFDRARQSGADTGTSADLAPSKPSAKFQGRARTLAGGEQTKEEAEPTASNENQPVLFTITFWANNVFTVDDGEPRDVMDPANRAFLEALGRGECPPELAPANHNTPININMVRRGQPYEPPAQPRHVAFRGRGRTLADEPGSSSAATPVSEATTSKQWEGVDDSLPTTSIQLRLADGSRLVARFNHSQTVADIRRFIAASRPDMPRVYSLVTAFPQSKLEDDARSIAESGLLNAVIIQKI